MLEKVIIFVDTQNNIAMKSLGEYKSLLHGYFTEKAAKYGVNRMGIFGSVARCEQHCDSDIDIIYEGAPNLLLRSKMKMELEALLGCKVDIIRSHKSNQLFENEIKDDIVYV